MPGERQLGQRALVRDEVRRLLARAPAYSALPPAERRRLGSSLEDAASVLVEEEIEAQAGTLDAVDFPAFVSDLVGGTFAAIVDASIQQMREYAELLGQAAASPGDFTRRRPDVASLREALTGLLRAGPAVAKHAERIEAPERSKRSLRRDRRRLKVRPVGDDGADDGAGDGE